MGDKRQIGARVDEDLYERFKQAVEDKHGRTRGVLSHEVENALRNYVNADNPTDPLARIENDVATIKASLAEQDGGEVVGEPCGPHTPSKPDTHTQTDDTVDPEVEDEFDRLQAGHPSNQDDDRVDSDTQADEGNDSDTLSKPNRKASHREKAEYVFHELANGGDAAIVPASAVESEVDRLWGFGERTTTKVIDRVFDRYHPEAVNKGPAWFVALGSSSEARDDAIAEWQDGDGEDTRIVPEDKFDGFEDDGTPVGVRR